MGGLAKVGHEEVGYRHAQVERHRAVLGKFRVDDAHAGVGGHDGTRVQVAMQHGLGVGGELHQQPLHLGFQAGVAAQLVHHRR